MPMRSPPTSRPFILFAPGAGAPSTSSWMLDWRTRLESLAEVETFDYPYMLEGRKHPDRAETLIAAHIEALKQARPRHSGPCFLAGKSMGSRIGCHVSLTEPISGIICFGYPLKAPGSDNIRDQVLLDLSTPILFLQGMRDPLCPAERLEEVAARMRAPHRIYWAKNADHSLRVSRAQQTPSQQAIDAEIEREVADFLSANSRLVL